MSEKAPKKLPVLLCLCNSMVSCPIDVTSDKGSRMSTERNTTTKFYNLNKELLPFHYSLDWKGLLK